MVKKKQKRVLSHSLTEQVSFNNIDLSYTLKGKKSIISWIKKVIKIEKKSLGNIDYNFCSDNYLLKINKEVLNHNFYTDIITYDLSDDKTIFGDIYISVDRVNENALAFGISKTEEMKRVIIHGVLHLCGHKDKSKNEIINMRNYENQYLSLLQKK